MKKSYILLIFTLVINLVSYAQLLTVKPLADGTPATVKLLIQNFLLDPSVQISNVSYKGNPTASGSFGGPSNIGFSAGLLLTTGKVDNAVGPNNQGGLGTSAGGSGSDVDLANLMSTTVGNLRDEAIIEFDFVATSDTVSFRYVFASEEYPEYVCGAQNDGFGFFISGANPQGGSYVSKNLAIIPGTPNTPVSIGTVNSGTKGAQANNGTCPPDGLSHSKYYADNTNGGSVQYDGFTVPLTAMALVKCGETYHIKLAIADVSDFMFDSGVFLEKGSFKTGGTGPKATTKIEGGVNDSTLMESCSGACLVFDRGKTNIAKEEKFKLTTEGTASNGVDYTLLPAEIVFPVGKDTVTVCIKALADGAAEGTETIRINLEKVTSGACDLTSKTRVNLVIVDKPKLEITKSKDTALCKSSPVNLWALASGGNPKPKYTYTWSGNGVTKDNKTIVTPVKTTTYYIIAKDGCGEELKDSVKIIIADSIKVKVTGKDASCGLSTGKVWLDAIEGGILPYKSKVWSTQPPQSTDTLTGLTSGQYKMTITDNNGCTGSATAEIINTKGMGGKVLNLQDAKCFGACNGQATIELKDGTPPYAYKWSQIKDPADTVKATRTDLCAGDYNVNAIDKNGCVFIAQVTIKEPDQLKLDILAQADSICFGKSDSLIALPSGGNPNYTVTWSPGGLKGNVIGVKPASSTVYQAIVTDINGCTVPKDFKVNVSPEMKARLNVAKLTCTSDKDGLTAWVNITGGFEPYDYSWLAPLNQAGKDTVYHLPSGTYTVSVADKLGCSAKDDTVITIPPPVKSVITRVTSTLCETSCDGSAVVNTKGGKPGYKVKWLTNPEQTADTARKLCVGVYKVVTTDQNNCSDTATATVNSPKPLKLLSIKTAQPVICKDSSSLVSAEAIGGLPKYKYTWNPGKLVGETVILKPDKTTEYTLVVTDSNNCVTEPAKIRVRVSQPMVITAKDLSNKCDSLGGKLVVAIGQGIVPYKYEWNTSPPQQSDTITGVGAGSYKVTVKDSLGCTASKEVNILVSPPPKFTFEADTIRGCQPLLVNFKITSSNIKSGGKYEWDFGDDNISKQANPANTFYIPGCHDIALTATNPLGCVHTDTVKCMVEVYQKPKASFTFTPNNIVMLLEPVVQFTDHSTNAVKLEWDFGDLSNLSKETNPLHTYTVPKTYQVKLITTSDKGCVDSSSAEIIVKEDVLVYIPNAFTPNNNGVNDVFKVFGNGIRSEDFQLLIYDRWGILVFKTNQINEGWQGKLNNSGNLLAEDVYVYILNYLDEDMRKRTRTGRVTLIK